MKELLIINAEGSHYEIGYSIGKCARALIGYSVDNYRRSLPREGWPGSWVLPRGFLEAASEIFPHFVEELQGMADGSGQDFEDLFFLNALEEALELQPPAACTSVGIADPCGGALLGHNEDWYAEDAEAVIVIYGRPSGKPAFVSVTAAPFLAAVGMNEAGIAQGVNSVSPSDCRVGVPRMFAARAVLEAVTLEEALTMAATARRSGGYNHLLVHADGRMGNLETSATAEQFIPTGNLVFHTNHYVNPQMKNMERNATSLSLTRYKRLQELAIVCREGPWQSGTLVDILRDHKNSPYSICLHAEGEKNRDATIFSVILNPVAFKTYVAVGNPCMAVYAEIQLNN
ncbi:MAG TPA: C45 family peptidase [Candidatus Limnocylindrales bacterium]|nr:C45 family peptidase [Candidatus Limnocylindrales bacterium]